MRIIDQKLNDYIWDNLSFLEAIFSEKIYKILIRFKEKKDSESFTETLEAVIEVDNELLERLEVIYQDYSDGIQENLKLDEVYYKKALIYFNNKEYEEARKYYEKVIQINSQYSDAYIDIGRTYSIQRKLDISIDFFQKAIKINPQDYSPYFFIGLTHAFQKDYTQAIKNYHKALELNPKHAKSYHELGHVYKQINNLEKSKIYLNKAVIHYENNIKHNMDTHSFDNLNRLKNTLNKAFFLDKNITDKSLYINRIKIQNFKQYKQFSIDFSNKINIIIGQNSIGKTTLFQAITLGLLKEDSSDAKKVEYEDYISKGEEKSKLTIYHNEEEKKVEILKEKRDIDKNYFIPFFLAYGSNFFTSKINEVKEVAQGIVNKTIHKGFTNSIFVDYTSGFVNPIRLLEFLDLEKDKKVPEIQKTFIDTINSFLEGFKLVENDKNYYFQKDGAYTKLRLEDLSEGYRGNVLLITDMLIKILGVGYTPATIEGIVLIDEFDKHLHPKWQSKLVNQLTKTFPNIQFIMTTHNPMSILDREPDEITILKEIDGEIVAVKGRGTKTIGVSVVLLEYFNVDTTVSDTMKENINNFNRLKLKKELTPKETEELKELEIFLGNTVASNIIYDRKYLKFLEFIRDHKEIDFDKYEKISDNEMDELLKDFGDFFDD